MKKLTGISIVSGIAVGPVLAFVHAHQPPTGTAGDVRCEQLHLRAAIEAACSELDMLERMTDGEGRGIFAFQQCLLADEGLSAEIVAHLEKGLSAAAAVYAVGQENAARLQNQTQNAYLCLRAVDVLDACMRVVNILTGKPRRLALSGAPVILAAGQMYPSDLLSVPQGSVCGYAAFGGSADSHAAILAKSLGLPAVYAISGELPEAGTPAILDGNEGVCILAPDEAVREKYRSFAATR